MKMLRMCIQKPFTVRDRWWKKFENHAGDAIKGLTYSRCSKWFEITWVTMNWMLSVSRVVLRALYAISYLIHITLQRVQYYNPVPFYRRNWGLKRLSVSPMSTQWVNGRSWSRISLTLKAMVWACEWPCRFCGAFLYKYVWLQSYH